MNQQQLQQTLATLKDELTKSESVDAETRTMLSNLAEEIHRLAESENPGQSDEVEPLTAQLQDFVLKFETDHPQLTSAVNQVSSALANLGI